MLTFEMMRGFVVAAIGLFIAFRAVVDIWPALMPGRLGLKIAGEVKKEQQRHPVGYWVEDILMMAIGAWIAIFGISEISN